MKCYIYKITSPTGKVYIGQTNNLSIRRGRYKRLECKNQTLLYNSLKKYGFENHIFEKIEECSKLLINDLEIYWINQYKSNKNKFPENNGMNLNDGGCGNRGFKHSDETKEILREKSTGHIVSDETKIILSELNSGNKHPQYGTHHSEESKYKNRLAHLGKSVNGKKINAFDYKTGKYIGSYLSYKECGEKLKINHSNIGSCLLGKRNHVGGYIFKLI